MTCPSRLPLLRIMNGVWSPNFRSLKHAQTWQLVATFACKYIIMWLQWEYRATVNIKLGHRDEIFNTFLVDVMSFFKVIFTQVESTRNTRPLRWTIWLEALIAESNLTKTNPAGPYPTPTHTLNRPILTLRGHTLPKPYLYLPIPYQYHTNTLLIPYLYPTYTLLIPYLYLTYTLHIPYLYLTNALPIPYLYPVHVNIRDSRHRRCQKSAYCRYWLWKTAPACTYFLTAYVWGSRFVLDTKAGERCHSCGRIYRQTDRRSANSIVEYIAGSNYRGLGCAVALSNLGHNIYIVQSSSVPWNSLPFVRSLCSVLISKQYANYHVPCSHCLPRSIHT